MVGALARLDIFPCIIVQGKVQQLSDSVRPQTDYSYDAAAEENYVGTYKTC
jgi:hypothetical protein